MSRLTTRELVKMTELYQSIRDEYPEGSDDWNRLENDVKRVKKELYARGMTE